MEKLSKIFEKMVKNIHLFLQKSNKSLKKGEFTEISKIIKKGFKKEDGVYGWPFLRHYFDSVQTFVHYNWRRRGSLPPNRRHGDWPIVQMDGD